LELAPSRSHFGCAPEYQKSPFSVWGSGASGFGIFFPAPLLQSANPYLARDHHPSLALAPHDWGC
jgi:hypothetical protein